MVPYLVGDFGCPGSTTWAWQDSRATELTFEGMLDNIDAVIDSLDLPRDRLTLVGGPRRGSGRLPPERTPRVSCRGGSRRGTAEVGAWGVAASRPSRPLGGWTGGLTGGRWEGDAAAFEARVAELVADGDPEPCVRRSHLLGPDGHLPGGADSRVHRGTRGHRSGPPTGRRPALQVASVSHPPGVRDRGHRGRQPRVRRRHAGALPVRLHDLDGGTTRARLVGSRRWWRCTSGSS